MTDHGPNTLPELLTLLFSDDELRRWMSSTFGSHTVAQLPAKPVPLADLAFQAIELIDRRGWTARVFPELYSARPHQNEMIRVVECFLSRQAPDLVTPKPRRRLTFVGVGLLLLCAFALLVRCYEIPEAASRPENAETIVAASQAETKSVRQFILLLEHRAERIEQRIESLILENSKRGAENSSGDLQFVNRDLLEAKRIFKDLHRKHCDALQREDFLLAHELSRDIHYLLFLVEGRYFAVAPKQSTPSITSIRSFGPLGAGYGGCRLTPEQEFNERYPAFQPGLHDVTPSQALFQCGPESERLERLIEQVRGSGLKVDHTVPPAMVKPGSEAQATG